MITWPFTNGIIFHKRGQIVLMAHCCLCFRFREPELIMRQLFLLVLAVNVEICCFTFLPLHFGHAGLAFSCSLKLCINENFFLQASQRYSYVGMFFPPYQDYWYCYFRVSILVKYHILSRYSRWKLLKYVPCGESPLLLNGRKGAPEMPCPGY